MAVRIPALMWWQLWIAGMGLGVPPAHAQRLPLPPRDHIPEAISFLSPLILPKLIADGYMLKEYVRSEDLARERKDGGDLYAVDCVFERAMHLSWNNIYEALLISAFALMDHDKFGVRLPLLGALIWVPLTSEFRDDFRARVSALPSSLYPDTPAGRAGDRDKLQHFFGSAFLTYFTESAGAADRIGLFVEWGEELFIVGGTFDERDVRANRDGQRFARSLRADPETRPSAFFLLDASQSASSDSGAAVPDTSHYRREAK